jgi:hypothetical protein
LPFLIDLSNRKVETVNTGDVPFSTYKIGTAAKAVAGVLRPPEKVVEHCVQSHTTTIMQNKISEIRTTTTQTARPLIIRMETSNFKEGWI